MKKLICIFIILILLFTNIVIAEKIEFNDNLKNNMKVDFENKDIKDDPPSWATGEFNGTWGVSIGGLPTLELGWVEGYFDTLGIFGRIEGDFATWENEEPTAYISTIVLGYFMIGIVGDYLNPDNATYCVGLGAPNEDGEFYYNIHLFIGPSWYMQGTWREI